MSRSVRKTPIFGNASYVSEAKDKKIWHSRFRHNTKQKLKTCTDHEALIDVNIKEVSDPWLMAKDGKRRIDPRHPKMKEWLRK
jgi:hypothetical protein